MRRTPAYLLPIALMLLLPAGVLAQGHEHTDQQADGPLHILHDLDETSGLAWVGHPVGLGYILLGEDGEPTTHKDGVLRVLQDGEVVYETHGTASAHDYDALNTAWFTFHRPGPFTIEAEVPVGDTTHTASFSGEAVALPPATTPAELRVDGLPATVAAGAPVDLTYGLYGTDGQLLDHTDVLIEVRDHNDQLRFRTHTHTHTEPQTLTYTFPDPGYELPGSQTFTVDMIGWQAFPTEDAPAFLPVKESFTVEVGPPQGFVNIDRGPPAGDEDGPYELHVTFDPEDLVGPFGIARFQAVVLDRETRQPVPHVNLAATLGHRTVTEPGVVTTGANLVFESESLHEYDGVWDLVLGLPETGEHVLWVTASRGDWSQSKEVVMTSAPAGTFQSAGPIIVTTEGLDDVRANEPTSVTLGLETAAGSPAMHSEVEFRLEPADGGAPLVLNKLHTHADGKMGFDVTFPHGGDWVLRVDPTSLEGEPSTSYHLNELGNGLRMTFPVEGPTLDDILTAASADGGDADDVDPQGVPVPLIIALAGLGIAVGLVARRQG